MIFLPIFFMLGAIFFVLFIIKVNLYTQKQRIEKYMEENGIKSYEIKNPDFLSSFFSQNNASVYQVTYQSANGDVHRANCKSDQSGVYWNNDRVIRRADSTEEEVKEVYNRSLEDNSIENRDSSYIDEIEKLSRENDELRNEVKRLRMELDALTGHEKRSGTFDPGKFYPPEEELK